MPQFSHRFIHQFLHHFGLHKIVMFYLWSVLSFFLAKTLLTFQIISANHQRQNFGRRNAMAETLQKVPIHEKVTLTIREAAEYSNIGINQIDKLLRALNCPFVLFVGTKKLVKRKEFEQFISNTLIL